MNTTLLTAIINKMLDYSVGGITWDIIKTLCSGLYKSLIKIGKKHKCETEFNNFMESISDIQVNLDEDIFLQLAKEYKKNTGMEFDEIIKCEFEKCIKENYRELQKLNASNVSIKVESPIAHNNSSINIIGVQNNI